MQKGSFQFDSLRIGYSSKILHSDLNCVVQSGEILAVLGSNGSGKSTLIMTLSGMTHPVFGKVYFAGQDIHSMSAMEKARCISVVLTGREQVTPSLRVREILTAARAPYTGLLHALSDHDKQYISEISEWIGIAKYMDRELFTLSDGEAQKVFISRALVQDTPVIILDEPTSHLDIVRKWEIYTILKEVSARGKIVIFATHEVEHALRIADSCLLMNGNGEHAMGTADNLISTGEISAWFDAATVQFDTVNRRFTFR